MVRGEAGGVRIFPPRLTARQSKLGRYPLSQVYRFDRQGLRRPARSSVKDSPSHTAFRLTARAKQAWASSALMVDQLDRPCLRRPARGSVKDAPSHTAFRLAARAKQAWAPSASQVYRFNRPGLRRPARRSVEDPPSHTGFRLAARAKQAWRHPLPKSIDSIAQACDAQRAAVLKILLVTPRFVYPSSDAR